MMNVDTPKAVLHLCFFLCCFSLLFTTCAVLSSFTIQLSCNLFVTLDIIPIVAFPMSIAFDCEALFFLSESMVLFLALTTSLHSASS